MQVCHASIVPLKNGSFMLLKSCSRTPCCGRGGGRGGGLGDPNNEEYSTLGSILGVHLLWETTKCDICWRSQELA